MTRAAAANERSSATLANMASPSKSGSFDIDNPVTMNFNLFYFENSVSTTCSCYPQRDTETPNVWQDL
jgi:hypothetical protein